MHKRIFRHFSILSLLAIVTLSLPSCKKNEFQNSSSKWQELTYPERAIRVYHYASTSTNVYAFAENDIYKSSTTTQTSNWISVSGGLPKIDLYSWCSTTLADMLFVGGEKGIYVTTDEGASWFPINTGLYDSSITSLYCDGVNLFAGTSNGKMYTSANKGLSWRDISPNFSTLTPHTSIKEILVNGQSIYLATNTGFYYSLNFGTSWQSQNYGLSSADKTLSSLALKDGILYGVNFSGAVTLSLANIKVGWTDNQKNFPGTITGKIITIGQDFYCYGNMGVFVKRGSATTWTKLNIDLKNINISSLYFNGDKMMVSSFDALYYSDNGGKTWTNRNIGFTNSYQIIYSFLIDGPQVYAATGVSQILKSNDNCKTWQNENFNLPENAGAWLLAKKGSSIIAASSQGIYSMITGGSTWTKISGSLKDTTLGTLTINNDDIYVGTYKGAYRSSNNGSTWEQLGKEMNFDWVIGIYVNKSNIYILTQSKGLFISLDNGKNWYHSSLTSTAENIMAIGDNLVATTQVGVFHSSLDGMRWERLDNKSLVNANGGSIVSNSKKTFIGIGPQIFESTNGLDWNNFGVDFYSTVLGASESGIYVEAPEWSLKFLRF